MAKKYYSKTGQIYNSTDFLPVDALSGPWASIEEFETFITERLGLEDLNNLPDGTKIRVVTGNSFKEYYRLNNAWKELLPTANNTQDGIISSTDYKKLQDVITSTATYRGIIDLNKANSLTDAASIGVYYLYDAQYGMRGLLSVQTDFYNAVSQILLSSVTPVYNGETMSTTNNPAVIIRKYANGSWSKWSKLNGDSTFSGRSLGNSGYELTVDDKTVTIPQASDSTAGVVGPEFVNNINNMANDIQEQALELSNATYSEPGDSSFSPAIEDAVLEGANKAAAFAAQAADEVIKSHAQMKDIYNTLESIKMSEDVDEGVAAAIAKNAGDIVELKTILGEKLTEATCTENYTMIEYNLKAGVSYVMDCDRSGGLEVHSMTENNIHSTVIEKLFTQTTGNRFVTFTPTQDVEYIRIYMLDSDKGSRHIVIYPVGISQKIDEFSKSIENVDDTRTKVLEVMNKVGGNLISFETPGGQYTTVACNIKKGNLYKITCSRSGSVQLLTKTINTTVSASDSHVVDNIQLSSVQQIYFTASNDASYIQVWSLNYAQTINISIDNIKEGNVFKGKKCVWLGTSIPANGIAGDNRIEAYPMIIGDILGMQVVNKSLSSSNVAIKNNAASITSKTSMLCLSMTKAEMKSMWGSNADTTVANSSFEEIFKSITPDTDIVVFDHGFNDRLRCHEDVVRGYNNIDFTSTDKNTWHGAFKFLLDKIYYINPRIKVIIAGYFSNNHTADTTSGNINTNDVCVAQEYLAKAYNLQILRVWNVLGVNDNPVNVSSEYLSEYNTVNGKTATSLTRFTLFCPDGVHPHTDKTGKSLKDYADAIVQCLNGN